MTPAARPRSRQILIVDDHELVRLGMSTLLGAGASGAGSPAVLEAGSLSQALALYAAHKSSIDLVLLDLHLPDTHGLSGLRSFLACHPCARIVALSGDNDPGLMREAMRVGALAFLSKSGRMAEVVDFVRTLAGQGPEPHASSTIEDDSETLATRIVQTRDGESVHLTQRQSALLDDLLTGLSNREIATRMGLAEGTVKNHVSALLLVFGVRSRAQLISRLR